MTSSELPALIASDVDGTLLLPDHSLPATTRETIAAVRRLGIQFVLASGRPVRGLMHLADREGIPRDSLVLFGTNGAVVADAATGTTLAQSPIDPDVYRELIEHLRGFPVNVMVPYDDVVFTLDVDGPGVAVEAGENATTAVAVNDLSTLDVPVAKVLVCADPAVLGPASPAIAAPFQGRLESSFSVPSFFEFTAAGVDKGAALRAFCAAHDIPLERTWAFGDNGNDVAMLATAGRGIAMENAIDAAKQAADVVTLDNLSDGVGHYLRTHLPLNDT